MSVANGRYMMEISLLLALKITSSKSEDRLDNVSKSDGLRTSFHLSLVDLLEVVLCSGGGGGSSRGRRQRRGEDVVHPHKVFLEDL
ncbi:hypothetical protein M8C21_014691, partial [Ambrosia artemisiifolia]